MQLYVSFHIYFLINTTKKSANTNKIFSLVILLMDIIPSLILSIYTDKPFPSAIWSIYTDRSISSVYTDHIADGLYRFLKSCNGVMTWIFSDNFTDGMTEGFKPGSPYSDVAHSPADLPTGRVRR